MSISVQGEQQQQKNTAIQNKRFLAPMSLHSNKARQAINNEKWKLSVY